MEHFAGKTQYNWEPSDGDGNKGGERRNQREDIWQSMDQMVEDYNHPIDHQHGGRENLVIENYPGQTEMHNWARGSQGSSQDSWYPNKWMEAAGRTEWQDAEQQYKFQRQHSWEAPAETEVHPGWGYQHGMQAHGKQGGNNPPWQDPSDRVSLQQVADLLRQSLQRPNRNKEGNRDYQGKEQGWNDDPYQGKVYGEGKTWIPGKGQGKNAGKNSQ